MASVRRSYEQYCALAEALDVVGERWTLLVVRELLIGPARFRDVEAALAGVGPNLLSARLRLLTDAGLVESEPVPGDGRGRRYRLTPFGETLREPVLAMARWGLTLMAREPLPEGPVLTSPNWGFLAVQAMVDGSRAGDVDEDYEFRVDDEVFHVEVRGGRTSSRRGPAPAPDLVVTTSAQAFLAVGSGHLSPFDAVATRRVTIDGPVDAMHRCIHLLGLGPGLGPGLAGALP